MGRNRKRAFMLQNGSFVHTDNKEKVRITLIIPTYLDINVELYAMATGQLKMSVVAQALERFLKDEGIEDPKAPPIITWVKP